MEPPVASLNCSIKFLIRKIRNAFDLLVFIPEFGAGTSFFESTTDPEGLMNLRIICCSELLVVPVQVVLDERSYKVVAVIECSL